MCEPVALQQARFTSIVASSGLAKTAVHRILTTLVATEFITDDSEREYRASALLSLTGRGVRRTPRSCA